MEHAVHQQVLKELPQYAWHGVPVSRWSDSREGQLTRCAFCLRYFELLDAGGT